MSHPSNRKERNLLGKYKGKKRASTLETVVQSPDKRNQVRPKDFVEHWAGRFKDTTKLCSCPLCGNPRKFFKDETMQEKRKGNWKEEI
jgi:hypothetical protein